MNEKQRAEFDVFWQEKILDAGWTLNKTESYFVWKRAWQAAISSVVVELPELECVDGECENFNNGFCAGYQDCMGDIKKSIELAGIRYE